MVNISLYTVVEEIQGFNLVDLLPIVLRFLTDIQYCRDIYQFMLVIELLLIC